MLIAAADPGIIAAFGAGMLSFVSPCVLPLLPGYLSLMSGVSSAQLAQPDAEQRRKLLVSTLLFVAGFTLVFVAIGASASALGQFLVDHRKAVQRVSGVLVIVMGIVLAGHYGPQFIQQERRFHVSPSRLGRFAAPVMGMSFAFGWTPCLGTVLAPILTLAASEGTLQKGVLLLTAYSLGLGVPFVLASVLYEKLASTFAWFKRNARVINLVAGLLLAAFGVLLLTDKVTWLSSRASDLLDTLGLDWLVTI